MQRRAVFNVAAAAGIDVRRVAPVGGEEQDAAAPREARQGREAIVESDW